VEPPGRTEPMDTNGITFTDCFICTACGGHPGTPPLDRPLRREPGVGAVLTGAGPLGLGYVLIVPELARHRHRPRGPSALSRIRPAYLG
jgi:hypothetical protein